MLTYTCKRRGYYSPSSNDGVDKVWIGWLGSQLDAGMKNEFAGRIFGVGYICTLRGSSPLIN
jgi:hypothetical protein